MNRTIKDGDRQTLYTTTAMSSGRISPTSSPPALCLPDQPLSGLARYEHIAKICVQSQAGSSSIRSLRGLSLAWQSCPENRHDLTTEQCDNRTVTSMLPSRNGK